MASFVIFLNFLGLKCPKIFTAHLRGPTRSLAGILKCLVSVFRQGFTSLSEIERHIFVLDHRLSLFHLGAVATFWPMSLVGIYTGRASSHPVEF